MPNCPYHVDEAMEVLQSRIGGAGGIARPWFLHTLLPALFEQPYGLFIGLANNTSLVDVEYEVECGWLEGIGVIYTIAFKPEDGGLGGIRR
jgi:hypothetical protein